MEDMKKFNSKDSFAGRSRFSNRDGGDYERGERRMFRATCAQCGRDCEVPFKPTGERPIYCSNCYEGQQGGRIERSFNDRPRWNTGTRENFGNRQNRESGNWQQLAAIESKLDKILKILAPQSTTQSPDETPAKPIKKTKKIKKETLLG